MCLLTRIIDGHKVTLVATRFLGCVVIWLIEFNNDWMPKYGSNGNMGRDVESGETKFPFGQLSEGFLLETLGSKIGQ